MKKMHVKRGDTVKVIAGKDKGKEGKIITAIPAITFTVSPLFTCIFFIVSIILLN